MTQETVQDMIISLKKLIETSSEFLALDDKVNPGKLHPYGKLNIDEQKILFNKHVQSIKSILQQYKRWIATEKDLNKYLSSLKDLAKFNSQVQQLKKCISDCHASGKKYWEGTNTGSKGRILLSRLQDMAQEFSTLYGLYVDIDELQSLLLRSSSSSHDHGNHHFNLSSDGIETATANLSSQTFIVDIIVDRTGEVREVKLLIIFAHTGAQSQDPAIDKELLDLLQAGKFDKFKGHIKALSKLDKLYRSYQVDLQTSLKNLENNLLQIGKSTLEADVKLNHATTGYGLLTKGCKGLRLDYYVPPFDLLDDAPKKKYGITLGLEEGGALVALPTSASQLYPSTPPTDNDQAKMWIDSFLASDNNQAAVTARFVGRLKPKIPFTFSILRQILAITSPESVYQEYPDPDGWPSLHSFLIGQKKDNINLESNFKVIDSNHHYVCSGPNTAGILVARLPFTHPQQLLPILQLVRQQVVFNELFKSCFSPSQSLAAYQSSSSSSLPNFLVEIVTDAPRAVSLHY